MKKIKSNKTLTEIAYEEILNAIIAGEIAPGDYLISKNLAEELNVSRTVINRALIKLENKSIVGKSESNNKMYVKKYNRKRIIDLWEIRIALELLAIRKLKNNIEEKDIKDLYSIFDDFKNVNFEKNYFSSDNIEKLYINQDLKFHKKIAELSKNKELINIINEFQLQQKTFNIGIIRPPKETLEEHLILIKSIEQRNFSKTESLMKDHLQKSIKML